MRIIVEGTFSDSDNDPDGLFHQLQSENRRIGKVVLEAARQKEARTPMLHTRAYIYMTSRVSV